MDRLYWPLTVMSDELRFCEIFIDRVVDGFA
jgi:hypothetical protein